MRLLCILSVLLSIALGWLAEGAPAPKRKSPKVLINSIGMKLVLIPAGKFMMGSSRTEKERYEEEQQHEVEITKPFSMGVYEVTQAQYKRVVGKNPSWFSADGGGKKQVKGLDTSNFPVEMVSYADAIKFCAELTKLEKKAGNNRMYTLPTEAQWEHACRGPSSLKKPTVFHFGLSLSSKQANFDGSIPYGVAAKSVSPRRTCAVGAYQPNRWGLYDMHGNVWEWCLDWYGADYYKKSPTKDPHGPAIGSSRVFRGGSWSCYGWGCRSACRNRTLPSNRYETLGFRVVMVPASN